MALYGFTVVLVTLALTYASVPLYRLYCQSTGKGGKAKIADDFLANKVKRMKKKEKLINVNFNADKEARMRWDFKPTQSEIKVYPGECFSIYLMFAINHLFNLKFFSNIFFLKVKQHLHSSLQKIQPIYR